MAAVNYIILTLDLTTARASAPVLPVGSEYDGVTVIQLPAGANVTLAFGSNKESFPLLAQGQSFAFKDTCDNPYAANEGLFVSNPAAAGILILMVSVPNRSA